LRADVFNLPRGGALPLPLRARLAEAGGTKISFNALSFGECAPLRHISQVTALFKPGGRG
jgi:hypothetical protein